MTRIVWIDPLDPAGDLFGCPNNSSVASASFATLLLLTQLLVCCIHRLNPQANADLDPEMASDRSGRTTDIRGLM